MKTNQVGTSKGFLLRAGQGSQPPSLVFGQDSKAEESFMVEREKALGMTLSEEGGNGGAVRKLTRVAAFYVIG